MEQHKSSISKNDHSRSFFTKQILEIVTNTNKQKEEINKTIIETRVLQKDLNRLTEKLDRTFQVTDGQLFKVEFHLFVFIVHVDLLLLLGRED